jgi:hypothetical protein
MGTKLVLRIKGRIWTEGAEENLWTKEKCTDRRLQKLHVVELRNLYSSSRIGRIAKSMRIILAGHVAQMQEYECM